jgi:hypothetical protein
VTGRARSAPVGGMARTSPRRVLIALIGVVACIGVAATLPHVADRLPRPLDTVARSPEQVWTRLFAPRVSPKVRLAGLTPAERDAVRTLAHRLDGRIVWSSNRSGDAPTLSG